MKYSIVTVTTNGLAHTSKCFESLFEFTKDFELIVVDNASDDGTVGYLKELQQRRDNVKVIFRNTRASFAVNNNIGLKEVTGEHIVFLNNDTILNRDWLDRLCAHLYNIPLTNLGMVGPVCNSSNGRQMVGMQDPEAWYRANRGRWSHTGKLFGWCILAKRTVIEEIGGFDERFINAYEDNDLCLRALFAGYKMAIAYDTYIYHAGQGTLRTMFDRDGYIKSGHENRERYFDKWHDPKPKKLVAIYRTNGGKHLEESLTQTSKFADHIILHFCRTNISTERLAGIRQAFPKICKVEHYTGAFQEDYERNWLLQEALKLHAAGEADWCISLDDDEIYEGKFIDRVQAMMNPRNPEILGYWCQWRTIWERRGDAEYWRADSTFGRFSNYRFYRLMKGQEIHSRHPEGHHCGSAPLMAEENLLWTNIRVKHLGYDTHEQRMAKYRFYTDNDHFKTARDIGNEDYSHLIDVNVALERWVSDNGISCIMMVGNEEDCILSCLESIAPIIDEFVIVDTGSTDKTVEIIEKFAKNAAMPVKLLHYPWCDNYSIPRNFAKRHATKRWILMLDADERFEYHDLSKVMVMTESEAEVIIFHVINYLKPTPMGAKPIYASTEAARLFRNIPELFYSGIVHETIDDAYVALHNKRGVALGRSPVKLHHYGYLRGKDRVRKKFEYYVGLNNKQLEITDGKDPRPYFNLALHWMQENKKEDAVKCFRKAIELNPWFWHASQQMAALNIRSAKEYMRMALSAIPEQHAFKKEGEEILAFLDSRSFGHINTLEESNAG